MLSRGPVLKLGLCEGLFTCILVYAVLVIYNFVHGKAEYILSDIDNLNQP